MKKAKVAALSVTLEIPAVGESVVTFEALSLTKAQRTNLLALGGPVLVKLDDGGSLRMRNPKLRMQEGGAKWTSPLLGTPDEDTLETIHAHQMANTGQKPDDKAVITFTVSRAQLTWEDGE